MKRLIIVWSLIAVTVSCAGNLKARLVSTHQGIETLLAAVDDGERLLCFGTVDLSAVPLETRKTCPGGSGVGMTDAKHQEVSKALVEAFAAQVRLGPAIQAWHTGDPMPKDLTTALADAQKVNDIAKALNPTAAKWTGAVANWLAQLVTLQMALGGSK